MQYRTRVFKGPDGSTATGVCGHTHTTYAMAVKCCIKVQNAGHGAAIQSRLCAGVSWVWLDEGLQPKGQTPERKPFIED